MQIGFEPNLDLSVGSETLNISKKTQEKNLGHLGPGKYFLNSTQNVTNTYKEKIKWVIKILNICSLKATLKQTRRQATTRRKYLRNIHQQSVSRVRKESFNGEKV